MTAREQPWHDALNHVSDGRILASPDAIIAVIKGLPAMQEETDASHPVRLEPNDKHNRAVRNKLRRRILSELENTK